MQEQKEFTGAKYGYVRVSTEEQTDQMQRDALIEYGVSPGMIFGDKMTGAHMQRPGLLGVLNLCRPGDMLVVWKLDRLGRTVKGVLEVIENLNEKNIELKSITEEINTTTPMGRMIMTILLALAQMERELISERTAAGIASKQATGWKPGPKHRIRDYPKRLAKFTELLMDDKLKDMTAAEIIQTMNDADPKAPKINAPQMYYNWKREGFPGLELSDPPLEGDDE
ncbi:recombinase family protein [uncultured Roseobacter sp.]|uniref:recombinase family protein n=1 Tax=uncultured Roseobacter sp. TaxID=114847 RepID=UPI00261D6AC0|nr:recombinase family protein [uncultured Roseobacter sp.]